MLFDRYHQSGIPFAWELMAERRRRMRRLGPGVAGGPGVPGEVRLPSSAGLSCWNTVSSTGCSAVSARESGGGSASVMLT